MALTLRHAAILTLPPLAWAANAVVGRFAVGAIPPAQLNFWRWVVVAALLLPLAWPLLRAPSKLARQAPMLAALGFFGMGCYNALQYLALHTSSPMNVTLIAASSPLWMMLVGRVGWNVKPTRRQAVGAALSLAGVLTVLSRGDLQALRGVRFVAGDLLMLVAIATWAVYSWLLARPPARFAAERAQWGWAEFLLAQTLFGLLFSGVAAGVEAQVAPLDWRWTPTLLALVLFVGAVPGLLAYRAWGIGVAAVGPAVAAFFGNLTPLFAALLSMAWLGDRPHAYHAAAFALIVAGIVVSSRARG